MHARATKRHAPTTPADDAADEKTRLRNFAETLRLEGPTEIARLVGGPVVVLDIDTGTITTLCGPNAAHVAHDLGVELADRTRRFPICSSTQGFVTDVLCTQSGPAQHIVMLAFDNVYQPQLRAVIVGNTRNSQNLATYHQSFQAALAAPTCPP